MVLCSPTLEECLLGCVLGIMAIAQDKPERAHQLVTKSIEDLDKLLRGRQCLNRLGRLDRRHTRGLVVHVLTPRDETRCGLDWLRQKKEPIAAEFVCLDLASVMTPFGATYHV